MEKMKQIVISGCCLGLLVSGCAPSVAVKKTHTTTVKETEKVESKYTGPKRRVAIVDFENKTAYGKRRLGTAASDILITELGKTGKFILVERGKIKKLLEEQNFQASGHVDSNTIVKVGKILGVNAIITGSISQFGVKKGGSDYLIVQSKQIIAQASVDIRVVDVETGQILYTDSGKGMARQKTGKFLGLGTKAKYDETLEGEALRAAIVKFTDNIVSQINKKPWSCRVAEIISKDIYIDAGRESGLEIGTSLKLFHLGKEIISPTTGLVIGRVQKEIGIIRVESYIGEDAAVAKLVKGTLPVRGDLCKLVNVN